MAEPVSMEERWAIDEELMAEFRTEFQDEPQDAKESSAAAGEGMMEP